MTATRRGVSGMGGPPGRGVRPRFYVLRASLEIGALRTGRPRPVAAMTFAWWRYSMWSPSSGDSGAEFAMAEVARADVETALKQVVDPYLEQDLVSAKAVKNVAVNGGEVTVDLVLGYPARGSKEALAADVRAKVAALPGVEN